MTKDNNIIQLEEGFKNCTYRLNRNTLIVIQMLSERFEKEAGFKIANGKIIELALNYISCLSLKELLRETN